MGNKNSHKDEPIAEQSTVSPRMQVFPASTVQMRGDVPCINLPRECRDVRYCRIVTADGTVEFRPDPNGEFTATQDGYRSYAPMPAGTAGVRYRRVINRTTGVVVLTPIHLPQPKTCGKRGNTRRTYTGTDIVNRIGSMLPCLKDGEKVTACHINLNNPSVLVVWREGEIQRTDPETMTVTTYRPPAMSPEAIDISSDWPTEAELKRFAKALTADLCKHGKTTRRERR